MENSNGRWDINSFILLCFGFTVEADVEIGESSVRVWPFVKQYTCLYWTVNEAICLCVKLVARTRMLRWFNGGSDDIALLPCAGTKRTPAASEGAISTHLDQTEKSGSRLENSGRPVRKKGISRNTIPKRVLAKTRVTRQQKKKLRTVAEALMQGIKEELEASMTIFSVKLLQLI